MELNESLKAMATLDGLHGDLTPLSRLPLSQADMELNESMKESMKAVDAMQLKLDAMQLKLDGFGGDLPPLSRLPRMKELKLRSSSADEPLAPIGKLVDLKELKLTSYDTTVDKKKMRSLRLVDAKLVDENGTALYTVAQAGKQSLPKGEYGTIDDVRHVLHVVV